MRTKNGNLRRRSSMTAAIVLPLLVCGALTLLLRVEARTPTIASYKTPSALEDPGLVRRYQQAISPDGLAARLYFLASDAFEGRETATRGQKMAADYLASQYRGLGLVPKGTVKESDPRSPRSYFQPFKLYKRAALRSELEVRIGGRTVAESRFSPEAQDDSSYFAFGRVADARGGVVFAGYGIEDDELKYKEMSALKAKDISLDGKWVMILGDEPLSDASTSLLPTPDRKPSRWSNRIYDKKLALWTAGRPAGVLIINDASPRSPKGDFIEQTSRAAANAAGIGAVSLYQPSSNPFPPAYFVSTDFADKILSASGRTVKDLAREIKGNLKPVVFDVKGAQIASRAEAFPPLESENVLAFIEGSDPKLKDEVVVITSHYDHLGKNEGLKGDQIYNGAADDGSGTVATLAIAEGFMRAKADGRGPRRSILFLNTSGEERGTLGSAFYTDIQPVIPLNHIVANINMDGIGGVDSAHAKTNPNYLYILGEKQSSAELLEMTKRLNQLTGTNLLLEETPNFDPNGSDHINFQKMLVPYVFYSTGLTEHYHKPSDEAQTINYERMALAVRLSFATAWQVANADAPPARQSLEGMVMTGYVCSPCRLECDRLQFKEAGSCPVCEMNLYPKYEARK